MAKAKDLQGNQGIPRVPGLLEAVSQGHVSLCQAFD